MKPEKLQGWAYVLGVLIAIALWFSAIHGLPPRVDKLEVKVSALETKVGQQETKLDTILDDVKMIKEILLRERSDHK